MDRIIDETGLEVQITEMDVRINDDESGYTSEKNLKQAELYYDFASACFARPECTAFITWGAGDGQTYIGSATSDWLDQEIDWPLPYDRNLRAKKAQERITDSIQEL